MGMDRRLLALGSDEIEKIRMSCSVRPVVQKFNKMTSLDDLAVLPLLIAGGEEPESSLPGLFLPRRRPDAGVTISSAASSHNLSGGFLYSLSDPVVSPVLLASNDPSVPLSAAPGIEQDGNILRVTTISSNFTGASTELILQGSDGFGTDLAQHLGSKLVMSAAVSGVFFGQLTDWDRTGAAEPATLLGDPTRSPWSKALPRSVEELGWEGPVVQDSNLQTISLRFATKTTSGLTVNLQRNSCPWVLTDGLPALGRIDVTNSTALDVNWTAMVEAVRVAEFDGVLGLSLWRSAADKRNFLDDLLDAVRPGEEVHVGAFEPRNGTAWWQARVGKEHIHKLPIVPSGNNAELEEWATHFDAVWTLDGIGGGMVNRSGVKVIVDPGPMILTNQDEASILLTSDLFDALNKAFTAAVAKSQIAGSPCDHLPALVFEKDAKVVFRLTSNSLCGCGGGKWWPSCALKVGKLVDGGSNATIRLGHAIADEYGHPDAYFLSYRGQQQTPELVIDTGGASLAFEPPKLTAAVRNHSLTVNFSANSVSLDMLGGEVGMFPPQTATPVSLRGWQASEHHFDSLPLGLRDPEAAPGEKSYLQKLLDRAQTRDPLADSVNFLWDQTSGQLKFSNTMSTSIWAAANPLATEPPLLGVPQQGASVLSFPVEAVPGGGWGLRVFAEDASLDPLQNPTGVNASDLMDKPKRLLLQAAGNVAWKTESQLLAIDYAGGRNLVVNEDIFHRVTDAWEKVLGVKKPSDTNSCEKLKVTIKYKLQTTQNLGRVNLTATGRGIRVATPQFLGQSEEGGIIEVTAQDFCECGGAAGKGCRLLLTSAGLSPAGLRLNSAVLQRLGRMEFAFTGDDNPAFVFVSADNYALFSSYQHALADAFQQAISRASNFPPHINCPWATEDPRQTLRSSPGLWPSVRGYEIHCHHDRVDVAPCDNDYNSAYSTFEEARQKCSVEQWCRFVQRESEGRYTLRADISSLDYDDVVKTEDSTHIIWVKDCAGGNRNDGYVGPSQSAFSQECGMLGQPRLWDFLWMVEGLPYWWPLHAPVPGTDQQIPETFRCAQGFALLYVVRFRTLLFPSFFRNPNAISEEVLRDAMVVPTFDLHGPGDYLWTTDRRYAMRHPELA